MKPLNLRANGGKTPKTTPGQQCSLANAFRPTCKISSALDSAIEKKYTESENRAFFSYKNQKFVMKPLNLRANGGKTPKTTPLRNNAPRKCLQAHMQHFFSPRPAIKKKIR